MTCYRVRKAHRYSSPKGETQVTISETHIVDREGAKLYLDYLDKEMNIMGILSAFCVATVGFSLKEVLGAQGSTPLALVWEHDAWVILIGSVLVLGAAVAFYVERSTLAWCHGQISLTLAAPAITGSELYDWLVEADSWGTWIAYRVGFFFLWAGLAGYGIAATGAKSTSITNHCALAFYIMGVIIALLSSWRVASIVKAHSYDNNPLIFKRFFGVEP